MFRRDFPPFERKFKEISKKHPSLSEDLDYLCRIIATWIKDGIQIANWPNTKTSSGGGKRCHYLTTRLKVTGLRKSSFRIFYAYYPQDPIRIVFIQIYPRGNQNSHFLSRHVEEEYEEFARSQKF